MLYIFLIYALTKLGTLCSIFAWIGIILFIVGIIAYFINYYEGVGYKPTDDNWRMARVLRLYIKKYTWLVVILSLIGAFSPSSDESKIAYAYIALKTGTETEIGKEAIETSKLYLKSLQKEFSDKVEPKTKEEKVK